MAARVLLLVLAGCLLAAPADAQPWRRGSGGRRGAGLDAASAVTPVTLQSMPQPQPALVDPQQPASPVDPPQPPAQPAAPMPAAEPAASASGGAAVELVPPAEAPPAAVCNLLEVLRAAPNATLFLEAASATGLTQLLADPNFQATLFVPTNRAWASLLRVLGLSREQLLAADPAARQALTQTVEYHFIPNAALSLEALRALPYLHRLTTLQGQPAMVYTEAGEVKVASTSRQIGFLLEPPRGPALPLCPGMLSQAHFVDAVLAPDPEWVDTMAAAAAVAAAATAEQAQPAQPVAPGDGAEAAAGEVALLEPPLLAAMDPVPAVAAPAAELTAKGPVPAPAAADAAVTPAAEPSLPTAAAAGRR